MEIKEFLKSKGCWSSVVDGITTFHNVKPEDIIEFTRYHVQEALKEALDNIPCLGSSTDIPSYDDVEIAVLNSYPLHNIK